MSQLQLPQFLPALRVDLEVARLNLLQELVLHPEERTHQYY
jgi:hypothetical protein